MRFTIVASHYQGSTSEEELERFLESMNAQTFKDWELLIYHDGPLLRSSEYSDLIDCTKERANKWGHNLRQLGIDAAKGEFIIHTNTDNLYYSNVLEELDQQIKSHPCKVYIGLVKMMGMNSNAERIWYDNPRDYSKYSILVGFPRFGTIDLMNLIAHRDIWKRYGWYSTNECSDGIIYEKMCKENEYYPVNIVLGEHY